MSNSSLTNLSTFTFETVTVDINGEIIARNPGSARYLTEHLDRSIALNSILIPSGSFMMGDRLHADEQPIHQVTVPAFYMSKYPITQAQYQAVMGGAAIAEEMAQHPIDRVSWDDALVFCDRLSQQTDKQYSLPSEAQWEYACRANSTTAFYFGETITPDLVNYNGDYPYGGAPIGENRAGTTPVGSFTPNDFGLYDLHGNVWEWCLDEYHPNYQGAPTDGSAWCDINTAEAKPKRVMRGGAWDYVARGCRSAVRCSLAPHLRVAGCGFRIVLEVI
jgi:formylglycine-generating enzyme required for sulfatase activity